VEEGGSRKFVLDGRAVVTREEDGEKTLDLAAERLVAHLDGEVVTLLRAEGGVVVTGRPAMGGDGERSDVLASGDSFRYDGERAVLDGAPARVLLREDDEGSNEIRAIRIFFEGAPEAGARLVAGGEVKAVVFLAGKEGGEPRPFTLVTDELIVGIAADDPDLEASAEGRVRDLAAKGNVSLDGVDWVAEGDLLEYRREKGIRVTVTGKPAAMRRTQTFHGREYHDSFTADRFRLHLRERRIRSFFSEKGGRALVHIAFEEGGPNVLGSDRPEEDGRLVERFSGGCEGPMSFDREAFAARLEKEAWIEQALGRGEEFESVGRFEADLITARLGQDERGADRLEHMEGRGDVVGTGDGWKVLCDGFEVDFVHRRTIIRGTPARLSLDDTEYVLRRAVYRYEERTWDEIIRGEFR